MTRQPEIKTVVTIDVEPDSDRDWRRKSPLSFSSLFHGLPRLARLARDQKVPFVFFISPEVLYDRTALAALLDFPAYEIGAHLHAEYVPPALTLRVGDRAVSDQFPCSDLDDLTEQQKIENLTNHIERLTGRRPVSYRAARYGADLGTVKALKSLGYKVDSSVTPGLNWRGIGGPDFRGFPEQPYFVSDFDFRQRAGKGLLEFPITVGGKRFPGLPDKWYLHHWLRPSTVTLVEQKFLIKQRIKKYRATGQVFFNVMFHSNEMGKNCSPAPVSERAFFNRLEQTLRFLEANGSSFYTLADIYSQLS